MLTKTATVIAVAAAGVLLSPTVAMAHPVGEPGTPGCFGMRVSHGSSSPSSPHEGHGLTPVERTAGLQALVDEGFEPAIALFGETVSVREWADFVRTNCSDTPYVP